MDDAGGGARGLRPELSRQLSEGVRRAYGLDITGAEDLEGSSCLNLRVGEHVVRVYRAHVDEARLEAMVFARDALWRAGVPIPARRLTRDGRPWCRIGRHLVEAEGFVVSDAEMDSWDRLNAGLPMLGRIHSVLATLGAEPSMSGAGASRFVNHIPASDGPLWAGRAATRIRSWGASGSDAALAHDLEHLAALLAEAAPSPAAAQIVHGDFWDNNVLFLGAELVAVIDLEMMGERPRADDAGLTLSYMHSTYADTRSDPERQALLVRACAAYESGLEIPLSDGERAAIPHAMARKSLWAARWLAMLDDERTARAMARDLHDDLRWCLDLAGDLARWQDAFVSRRS